jgi:uncharacterized protein (TIGR04255 family)
MNISTEKSAGKRIKFENPPINELAIALFYLPIQELRAQHVGVYWDRIRSRFPLCEQQPPIAGPGEKGSTIFQDLPGEVFPLPRFWFSSPDHPTLIQVQRNGFMLNWRRLESGEYPHYETVMDDFWKEFQIYKAFIEETVGGTIDVIQNHELTYINMLNSKHGYEQPSQLANIIPLTSGWFQADTDDRRLTGLNTSVTFRITPTLHIDLAIKLGHHTETKEPLAMLELKAHGAQDHLSLDGARAWYDSAHDATYKLFLDITDKTIQENLWRPR